MYLVFKENLMGIKNTEKSLLKFLMYWGNKRDKHKNDIIDD